MSVVDKINAEIDRRNGIAKQSGSPLSNIREQGLQIAVEILEDEHEIREYAWRYATLVREHLQGLFGSGRDYLFWTKFSIAATVIRYNARVKDPWANALAEMDVEKLKEWGFGFLLCADSDKEKT